VTRGHRHRRPPCEPPKPPQPAAVRPPARRTGHRVDARAPTGRHGGRVCDRDGLAGRIRATCRQVMGRPSEPAPPCTEDGAATHRRGDTRASRTSNLPITGRHAAQFGRRRPNWPGRTKHRRGCQPCRVRPGHAPPRRRRRGGRRPRWPARGRAEAASHVSSRLRVIGQCAFPRRPSVARRGNACLKPLAGATGWRHPVASEAHPP
jgi:hypothetical protein